MTTIEDFFLQRYEQLEYVEGQERRRAGRERTDGEAGAANGD